MFGLCYPLVAAAGTAQDGMMNIKQLHIDYKALLEARGILINRHASHDVHMFIYHKMIRMDYQLVTLLLENLIPYADHFSTDNDGNEEICHDLFIATKMREKGFEFAMYSYEHGSISISGAEVLALGVMARCINDEKTTCQ